MKPTAGSSRRARSEAVPGKTTGAAATGGTLWLLLLLSLGALALLAIEILRAPPAGYWLQSIENRVGSYRPASGAVSVREFGAKGDGESNDAAAFRAAVAALADGGTIYVPRGTYLITSDITYPSGQNINWIGDGYSSLLDFRGAGLVILGDDRPGPFTIEKLRLRRRGAPGRALSLDGSTLGGVDRWALRDLHITSAGGTGLYIEGSWIGLMDNVIVQMSRIGVELNTDSEGGSTSMNALTVTGGEVQACGDGWVIRAAAVVNMFGHAVEGCTRGITTTHTPRAINIHGGYFEHNAEYDVSFGAGAGGVGYGGAIRDSLFFAPGGRAATRYAILLNASRNVTIEGNSFVGYRSAGVRLVDGRAASTGLIRHNYLSSTPLEVSTVGARTP